MKFSEYLTDKTLIKLMKREMGRKAKTKEERAYLEALIDNMDMERLENLDEDITTAEGMVEMFNEVIFHGDWKRRVSREIRK